MLASTKRNNAAVWANGQLNVKAATKSSVKKKRATVS
jgi:hypothetical protein